MITAAEALRLCQEGRGRIERMDHANPFTDSTISWAVLYTGEYVDLGEVRPGTGLAFVPGTLRWQSSDTPNIVIDIRTGLLV
jgi:hypothetical protein